MGEMCLGEKLIRFINKISVNSILIIIQISVKILTVETCFEATSSRNNQKILKCFFLFLQKIDANCYFFYNGKLVYVTLKYLKILKS